MGIPVVTTRAATATTSSTERMRVEFQARMDTDGHCFFALENSVYSVAIRAPQKNLIYEEVEDDFAVYCASSG